MTNLNTDPFNVNGSNGVAPSLKDGLLHAFASLFFWCVPQTKSWNKLNTKTSLSPDFAAQMVQ